MGCKSRFLEYLRELYPIRLEIEGTIPHRLTARVVCNPLTSTHVRDLGFSVTQASGSLPPGAACTLPALTASPKGLWDPTGRDLVPLHLWGPIHLLLGYLFIGAPLLSEHPFPTPADAWRPT